MPTWVASGATSREALSVTPQSSQASRPRPTGRARETFLQPEINAADSVSGAEKSCGTVSFGSEVPELTTQTVSHRR